VKPKGEKPKAEPRPKPDPKPKAESKPKAPHAFLYIGMLQIAADVYSENVYRSEIKPQALKQAWIKIADLLCRDATP
jgi:hypothetical protein